MDKGLVRKTRAMPQDGQLRSHRDEAGRLVYQLHYPDDLAPIVGRHLINPQPGDIGDRTAIYHGYERDLASGQLFAQAWEIEAARR